MKLLVIRCPKCSHSNPDYAKGCQNCGYDFTKKKTMSKSFNTKIIAAVAIIVVIAIVGVLASGMLSSGTSDSVTSNSNSEVVAPVADNNTSDDTSSSATEYWASAKADKFHLPTCEWAEKISDNNKIVYHSRDDAVDDGKVPCGVCNP